MRVPGSPLTSWTLAPGSLLTTTNSPLLARSELALLQ